MKTPAEEELTMKYYKLDKEAIHRKEESADTANRRLNTPKTVHNRTT